VCCTWKRSRVIHHGSDHAKLIFQPTPDLTDAYLWQDRGIAFHRCKACGCVTHIAAADIVHSFGVNARKMPALDPESVTVIQMNNSPGCTRRPDRMPPSTR